VFEFSFQETLQSERPIVVLLHGRQKPDDNLPKRPRGSLKPLSVQQQADDIQAAVVAQFSG
jgi:hypothetical protein